MEYTRQENDREFRRISLKAENIPQFQGFTAFPQTISDSEDLIIEIKREDGTTAIIGRPSLTRVYYRAQGTTLYLTSGIPTAHLFVCAKNCPEVKYRIPKDLPKDGAYVKAYIPAGATNVLLQGDKYFEAAYQLVSAS